MRLPVPASGRFKMGALSSVADLLNPGENRECAASYCTCTSRHVTVVSHLVRLSNVGSKFRMPRAAVAGLQRRTLQVSGMLPHTLCQSGYEAL
eukprot:4634064-Amphidinium_carterae.1